MMNELLETDRRVYAKMSPAIREGAHLAVLHPIAHPGYCLKEMEAFRLLKAHPEMRLSARSALSLYEAMTAGTDFEGWGFRKGNCVVKHGDYVYVAPSGAEAPILAEELFARCQYVDGTSQSQTSRHKHGGRHETHILRSGLPRRRLFPPLKKT